MSTVDLLEWTFDPPDYFGAPIEVARSCYKLTIGHGVAEANVDASVFDADPSIRDTIHGYLNDRLLGAQIVAYRPYRLSSPRRTRIHPDGRREVFIELTGTSMVISGGTVGVRITRPDGSLVYDSERESTDRRRSLSELVAIHRPTDVALASMLASYDAAIRDPQNELVHLYEIRDCLSTRFGGKAAAIGALGISSSQWSRLGQLCNDEPLAKGRHRGKVALASRETSEAMVQEARALAQAMLHGYLAYLERAANKPS